MITVLENVEDKEQVLSEGEDLYLASEEVSHKD